MSVDTPYDWEHYDQEFRENEDYRAQEAALNLIFHGLPEPMSILEVGPGLGRITKMALKRWPMAEYSAADVALAPLAEAERLSGGLWHSFKGPIQAEGALALLQNEGLDTRLVELQFDLVLAIEVLLHIPPEEVGQAVKNLLGATTKRHGHLVTCDWTEPLPGDQPIRVQNYRHDYPALFQQAGATFALATLRTGYQTIYVVRP